MKLLPDWLLSALSDGATPPATSMSRLSMLLVLLSCICLPMVLWFWLSSLRGQLLEIPGSIIGFMAAAGTLVSALFAINKRAE